MHRCVPAVAGHKGWSSPQVGSRQRSSITGHSLPFLYSPIRTFLGSSWRSPRSNGTDPGLLRISIAHAFLLAPMEHSFSTLVVPRQYHSGPRQGRLSTAPIVGEESIALWNNHIEQPGPRAVFLSINHVISPLWHIYFIVQSSDGSKVS